MLQKISNLNEAKTQNCSWREHLEFLLTNHM